MTNLKEVTELNSSEWKLPYPEQDYRAYVEVYLLSGFDGKYDSEVEGSVDLHQMFTDKLNTLRPDGKTTRQAAKLYGYLLLQSIPFLKGVLANSMALEKVYEALQDTEYRDGNNA